VWKYKKVKKEGKKKRTSKQKRYGSTIMSIVAPIKWTFVLAL